ncbi:MAG: peptidase S41, partial [Deinococcus sp.]|nr:peptidase S41 [Deinococcus sp.]
PNGASVVLVVQEWLTPQQNNINGQGITPDLVVTQERQLPLALRGENASPGDVISLWRNSQPLGDVVAGADGTFTFLERHLTSAEEGAARITGEALVDPEHDVQLRAALEYLGARP